MVDDFAFGEKKSENTTEALKEKQGKEKINFQEMPKDFEKTISLNEQKNIIDKYTAEQVIPMPSDNNNTSSYLNLVLSPNFRELELMIRGLEYVKRLNPITGKEEVLLRKIEGHALNEHGVNKIMEFLKIYSSPEIKLGRKISRDYYNSVRQVSRDAKRLIYKNLKNFGMDTQVKQRSAKTFALAIIEFVDASFSRSIEGRENDLSRATNFEITGSIDALDDPAKMFNKKKKDELKN